MGKFICCQTKKIPTQEYVYGSSIGVVALPFNDARELIVHNRNNIDIVISWVGSLGSSNKFIVPAIGTNSISLIESEGIFQSINSNLGLFGFGTINNNSIVYNFKN